MSKIIAVTGATGAQGGGVVNIMRITPGWQVRAITRNRESEAAKSLARLSGVEVVEADYDDKKSLIAAFEVFNFESLPYLSHLLTMLFRE